MINLIFKYFDFTFNAHNQDILGIFVLLKDILCEGYTEQDHLNSRNGQTGLGILNLDLELLER